MANKWPIPANTPRFSRYTQVRTALELNERQRTVWIDTLSQAANVALAALLFGQFVSDRPFSIIVAVGGFAAWSALIGWSTFLARSRNR